MTANRNVGNDRGVLLAVITQLLPFIGYRHTLNALAAINEMTPRTWLITGVSSGFGRELTTQLLGRGDRVVGTVRRSDTVADLVKEYPETFRGELLDVADTKAIPEVVDRSFADLGRVDVIVSNAGYGLFGAAEELTGEQIDHVIATNLLGSIQLIRGALPHLRAQGGGRVIQLSTYGGQVAFPGNSMYHATNWGIEGFVESVAQEVAPFGIGIGIGIAWPPPSSPAPTTNRPLGMILGAQALGATVWVLKERIAAFEAQTELAASADFPPGE